jgi:hypothetical protein
MDGDGSMACRADQVCSASGVCVGTTAGHDPESPNAMSTGGAGGSSGDQSDGAGGTMSGSGGASTDAGGGCVGAACKMVGDPCTSRSECKSTFCKDGYCCESACNETCQSCGLTGSEGSCSPVRSQPDPDTCGDIYTCAASGACKLADNQKCAVDGDCANNACNAFHPDTDGDTFGDAKITVHLCSTGKPPGYTTDGTDCCDSDPAAHPGETTGGPVGNGFYYVANKCGTFDYNCDGMTTKNYAPYTEPMCNASCSNWYCFDPAAACGGLVNLMGGDLGHCTIGNPNYTKVYCR